MTQIKNKPMSIDRNSAKSKIQDLRSSIGFPRKIKDESLEILIFICGSTKYRKPEELMISASVYTAARKVRYPMSSSELAEFTSFDKWDILECYGLICEDLDSYYDQVNPKKFVKKYSSILSCDPELEHLALQIVEAAVSNELNAGRSPSVIGASAIYAAVDHLRYGPTQREIGDSCFVSKKSITNLYPKLLDEYLQS